MHTKNNSTRMTQIKQIFTVFMKHKEVTDKIISAFYKVYNTLGFGFLEKVYEKALLIELKKKGFNVWYCNIGGAVDDGIAMGHFGMKYSLPSRELITDQIETVIGAHPCDGWIGIGNCDKIVPGMLNAMVRLNIPSVYVSGGPMLAGQNNTDLVTHNYYVIVGLLISALLLAYFDMKNGVVWAGDNLDFFESTGNFDGIIG